MAWGILGSLFVYSSLLYITDTRDWNKVTKLCYTFKNIFRRIWMKNNLMKNDKAWKWSSLELFKSSFQIFVSTGSWQKLSYFTALKAEDTLEQGFFFVLRLKMHVMHSQQMVALVLSGFIPRVAISSPCSRKQAFPQSYSNTILELLKIWTKLCQVFLPQVLISRRI